LLVENKPVAVSVKTGLSNAGFVAVEGDITEGQQVIVGALTSNANKAQTPQQSPLGGAAPGMGRRF
ncbi:MAG: hypothetical protein PHC61_17510, partial [Chitinivibrionales bacterium]|nr:hypothetical protein [Chitinivibrionales bacterium]